MTGRKWLLYFAAGSVLTGEAFAGKNSERKNEKDKTPPQRLTRLVKFSKEWLQINIRDAEESSATKLFRNNLYNRLVGKIERKTTMMMTVYNRENNRGERRCGYYDPTTTYGGPQVEAPALSDNKVKSRREYLETQRNRRHLIIDEFKWVSLTAQDWHHIRRDEDLNHIEDKIIELEKWFKQHLDSAVTLDMLTDDDDEDNSERHRRAPSVNTDQGKFGTANTRYDKSDPITGWKQIATGFRKWGERYVAYCAAEYVEKSFSKWATEVVWRKTENVYRCKVLGQDREGCDGSL